MKKENITQGNVYKLVKSVDGKEKGTEVVFKWWTEDGKWGICNPVGEMDMQSSFSISSDEIEEISVEYQLTLSTKQANVLIDALDAYSRIGMGQLEIVAESIIKQYKHKYSPETMNVVRHCMDTAKISLGHPVNGCYGIMGTDTPKSSQIAYDIQCVLRKLVAQQENHGEHSVWHNDPLHADRDTPLAKVLLNH